MAWAALFVVLAFCLTRWNIAPLVAIVLFLIVSYALVGGATT